MVRIGTGIGIGVGVEVGVGVRVGVWVMVRVGTHHRELGVMHRLERGVNLLESLLLGVMHIGDTLRHLLERA